MSELEFGVWNLTLGIENKTSEKAERFQNLILKIKLLKEKLGRNPLLTQLRQCLLNPFVI